MDTKQEAVLQAVVLADPFEHQSRYGPLVRGGGKDGEGCETAKPWCLLPLCNAPLIAWTLESLAASNVKNTFIVIREGAQELQEWLDQSTFTGPTAYMTIKIRQTQAFSEGDVMREVDGLSLPGDWILAKAGYIGNLDLEKAVQDFSARRKKEPELIMECIVAQRTKAHASKVSTHVLTPQKRLIHFMHHPRYPRRKRTHLPLELLEEAKDLAIRTDLESCGVEICNMEVPALFVENFDYENMRPDFINGVLTSDLLGKTFSCSVVGEKNGVQAITSRSQPWAAHVGHLSSYAHVSKSILSRWSYPLVPDETLPGSSERYEQRRGRLYLGQRLKLSRSCTIGSATIIGHGVSVGDHASVSHSVIGQDCTLGARSSIIHSFIDERATIREGCTISNSIVGAGAVIEAGASVTGGSIVGPGVVVGEGAELTGQRLSVEPFDDDESQTNGVVGGNGHIWPNELDIATAELDSDDEDALDPRNLRISQLLVDDDDAGMSSASSSASTISRSSSSDSLASAASASSSRASGMTEPPAIAGIGALSSGIETNDAAFERECRHSLDRSFEEGHTVENASIELKTLRMATNVTMKRVTGVAVSYMCEQVKGGASTAAAQVTASVDKLVERWGGLITSLTGNAQSSQVDVLLFLQEHCATAIGKNGHPRLFPAFLQAFYQEDVVSEEAIRAWVTSPAAKSTGGEAGQKLWQTGAAFMRALMEADDDEDSDEE